MKNEKEIKIVIKGEEWKNALDDAFDKVIKNIKVDGFRKGKVPKNIFMKNYGIEYLYDEAAQICSMSAFDQMAKKAKDLDIVAQPEIRVGEISEDHIEYVFTLTLKPEIKLGKYKDLGIKKGKVNVSKKEIEEAIQSMREQYKENIVKDGSVEKGDIAVIDFEGFKDGVAFDGGKGENYSLEIGSNTFIPGFEDQIIGMKAGEEKDINVTFPEDYQAENLKGQPVVFKVKVEEVKTVKLPELDKDFFEDLGMEGIDTKEALENQVKENIKARKQVEVDNKYTDELLAKIAETTEVEIPEVMIHDEAHRMVHQFADHIAMQGISIEQFYQMTNSSEADLMEKYKDEALKRVKTRLILDEIIKKEKIEVSDEEIEKHIEELANKYQMTKEEVKKDFNNDMEYVRYDLQIRKAFEIIK